MHVLRPADGLGRWAMTDIEKQIEGLNRTLTSSPAWRREIPTESEHKCSDLFGGFLLQRDSPEEKAWFSPQIFPQWGILRCRTNHIFPQVSRSLHRLTRHALPPVKMLTQEKGGGNIFCAYWTASLSAPYISALKGRVLRSVQIKVLEKVQVDYGLSFNQTQRLIGLKDRRSELYEKYLSDKDNG